VGKRREINPFMTLKISYKDTAYVLYDTKILQYTTLYVNDIFNVLAYFTLFSGLISRQKGTGKNADRGKHL
jgi:hypothetical protein